MQLLRLCTSRFLQVPMQSTEAHEMLAEVGEFDEEMEKKRETGYKKERKG